MEIIFFMVSFTASVVGAICGVGGGILIKPILDATGVMSVSSISFLSGCTVLSMSIVTVTKQFGKKEKSIDVNTGTPLALGAAMGGILGKNIFQLIYVIFPNENTVGAIQASTLVIITIATLVYTLYQSKIKTRQVTNKIACVLIGLGLGLISSFLGIGGGPINLIVLAYFFSMDTKKAASNSLYIIMFSQAASLISTIVTRSIPEYSLVFLVLMVVGGMLGGNIGSKICDKISQQAVRKLFIVMMIFIIAINIYNTIKFGLL